MPPISSRAASSSAPCTQAPHRQRTSRGARRAYPSPPTSRRHARRSRPSAVTSRASPCTDGRRADCRGRYSAARRDAPDSPSGSPPSCPLPPLSPCASPSHCRLSSPLHAPQRAVRVRRRAQMPQAFCFGISLRYLQRVKSSASMPRRSSIFPTIMLTRSSSVSGR